ncbi:hypothetical protein ACOSQ4_012851 [Xanthoceras sorbifolium]
MSSFLLLGEVGGPPVGLSKDGTYTTKQQNSENALSNSEDCSDYFVIDNVMMISWYYLTYEFLITTFADFSDGAPQEIFYLHDFIHSKYKWEINLDEFIIFLYEIGGGMMRD